MIDQLKNVMIGLFVIVAVAIIIFALMFLHPSVGDERHVLRVRFVNIDKISVGTRVTFAGKPVGEVASIHELKEAINERVPYNGQIYAYELVLHVDSNVNVFNTDEISARTSGLLGEKSVVIIPLPLKEGQELRLVNDDILYATEVGSVEDALKGVKEITNKVDTALDTLTSILTDIQDQKIVENLGTTMKNISEMTSAMDQPERLNQIVVNLHQLSVDALKSWPQIDTFLKDLNGISTHGVKIFTHVQSGEGTLGRLVMNDQLYLKLNSLLSKGETILNDINHYGLLFNTDKGWQRLRARRLNLLNTLSSPQEFRNYFNDELDQINTSLSRVYTVIEETSCLPACCGLLQNCEFQKVYAELLRRVSDTEEALRMYNQQVMDCDVRKTELAY